MRLLINFIFSACSRYRLCKIKPQRLHSPGLQCIVCRHHTTLLTSTDTMDKSLDIFKGSLDRFNGVTVRSDLETCDVGSFENRLENSIKQWREDGRRGIWFRIHLEQSDWVSVLAKKGFRFHHAKDDFVMMYLWLPQTEDCNIPPYAHTMMGVGAVVINEMSELLVVCEKYNQVPHWKLPGGYVEPGENLVDAAIREVFEETGIKTEFQTLLTLRHTHHGMFGCSDIYTVVSLTPLTYDIEKCDREIDKCKWMAVNEYLKSPNTFDLNRFFVEKYLEYSKKNLKIDCRHGIHQIIKKPYTVYYLTENDQAAPSNGS